MTVPNADDASSRTGDGARNAFVRTNMSSGFVGRDTWRWFGRALILMPNRLFATRTPEGGVPSRAEHHETYSSAPGHRKVVSGLDATYRCEVGSHGLTLASPSRRSLGTLSSARCWHLVGLVVLPNDGMMRRTRYYVFNVLIGVAMTTLSVSR